MNEDMFSVYAHALLTHSLQPTKPPNPKAVNPKSSGLSSSIKPHTAKISKGYPFGKPSAPSECWQSAATVKKKGAVDFSRLF